MMPDASRVGNITGAAGFDRESRAHVATHSDDDFALLVVQRRSVNEWIDAATGPKLAARLGVKCLHSVWPTQHQLFAAACFNNDWRAPGAGPGRFVLSRFCLARSGVGFRQRPNCFA